MKHAHSWSSRAQTTLMRCANAFKLWSTRPHSAPLSARARAKVYARQTPPTSQRRAASLRNCSKQHEQFFRTVHPESGSRHARGAGTNHVPRAGRVRRFDVERERRVRMARAPRGRHAFGSCRARRRALSHFARAGRARCGRVIAAAARQRRPDKSSGRQYGRGMTMRVLTALNIGYPVVGGAQITHQTLLRRLARERGHECFYLDASRASLPLARGHVHMDYFRDAAELRAKMERARPEVVIAGFTLIHDATKLGHALGIPVIGWMNSYEYCPPTPEETRAWHLTHAHRYPSPEERAFAL